MLNLGIEGTMLMGAMAGYLVTYRTGSLGLGSSAPPPPAPASVS